MGDNQVQKQVCTAEAGFVQSSWIRYMFLWCTAEER